MSVVLPPEFSERSMERAVQAFRDVVGSDHVLTDPDQMREFRDKALKEEFKARGLLTAAGDRFTITRSDQVSSRLDTATVKTFLGDAWRKFETASITTVIRIKASSRLAQAA